jgi:hypothetical protein
MGHLISPLFSLPGSLPVSHSSIERVGKAGKQELTRKVPKRENREKREGPCLLPFTGAKHE